MGASTGRSKTSPVSPLPSSAALSPEFISMLAADIAREQATKSGLIYSQRDAFAYVALRMPATYAVLVRVLREVRRRAGPDFAPTSVLDFGSGPAVLSWALAEVWDALDTEKPCPIKEVTHVEFSAGMRFVGEQLLTPHPFPFRSVWSHALPASSMFITPSEIANAPRDLPPPRHSLVLTSYALNELPTLEQRIEMAGVLWDRVEDGGVLVIVEPGTPFGFVNIKAVRQALIDSSPSSCEILAPCPHSQSCPKAASSWCHFVQRVTRTHHQRVSKVGTTVGFEDEKFAYLVIRKRGPQAEAVASEVNHKAIVAHPSSADEVTDVNAIERASQEWGRVLGEPRKKGKHVYLNLCTSDGEIRDVIVGRTRNKVDNTYRLARRCAWGDVFPDQATKKK
eukprot:c13716_g1_i1.p1 GENE.c13716_g1_i1~~c13716_g1_i1.p1  ORF type:complete len:395 (+),score=77.87 c13716_g1_i1:1-1185(+)